MVSFSLKGKHVVRNKEGKLTIEENFSIFSLIEKALLKEKI